MLSRVADFVSEHVLALSISTAVLLLLGFLTKVMSADGRADFCYIEVETYNGIKLYRVYQHVPWRPNRTVSIHTTLDEAHNTTKQLECPLR